MRRLLVWTVRLSALALVGLVLAVAVAGYLATRSLPDYDGELVLEGLSQPVTITRDANAVPHIRAGTPADAWFALGLAHAQDRLWQMEVSRRAVQGRLAAVFGPRLVPMDRFVKTLDLYGRARRSLPHQTDATLTALGAYSDGVNAWIRHVNARALGRGAPEFFVFGAEIAPWTPADSLGILKMMSLRLTDAAAGEVRRALFQLQLPPERVADILPDDPGGAVMTAPRYAELFPGARFAAAGPARHDPMLDAIGPGPLDMAGASNAWAVDGSRSSTRAPLLANDPHLWLSAPSVWYLADVKAPGLSAIGGTLPGVPAVVIGHNGRVGWGMTTTQADDQDIYIERLNPDDPAQYRTPEGWAPFETRAIRIEIDGEPARVETVRETRHGPVLPPDQFEVGLVTPEGHVAALAWTALTDRDRSLSALVAMTGVETIEAAVAVTDMAVAPSQTVTLADAEGVGVVVTGALPARNPQSRSLGRLPSIGWIAENDWEGIRPASESPRALRPDEGSVATANNRLTDAAYPDHISHDWDYPYRIERLRKELSARRFHSRDSFIALQADMVSEMARTILPLVARDLWWRGEGVAPPGSTRRKALDLLAEWSGEMDRHSPAPLIFSEWMLRLTALIARDELGPLLNRVPGIRPLFLERVYRDVDGAGIWCDVTRTPEAETCGEMAARALDEALARLTAQYGANMEGWRWGAAHLAVHRHMPLGFAGPFGWLVNISQETSGGNNTLLRGLSSGRGETPHANLHAAGLRIVLDFADLDRSAAIISTGQSGHPLSRWYDHMAEKWARGEMVPLSAADPDARAGAVGVLQLRPAGD